MRDKRFIHVDEAQSVTELTGQHRIDWVPATIHLTDPVRTHEKRALCGMHYGADPEKKK